MTTKVSQVTYRDDQIDFDQYIFCKWGVFFLFYFDSFAEELIPILGDTKYLPIILPKVY